MRAPNIDGHGFRRRAPAKHEFGFALPVPKAAWQAECGKAVPTICDNARAPCGIPSKNPDEFERGSVHPNGWHHQYIRASAFEFDDKSSYVSSPALQCEGHRVQGGNF